ncbi:phBC6A51 family helix-turn-helix protein [candidate division KSB1 bacterium]
MPYKNLLSKKRKFIEILKTSDSNKPESSEIIKDLGISRATYYRWSKDKEILELAEKENEQHIDVYLPDVLDILLKKALQGDISAIKLFLQRYDTQGNIDDEEILTPDRIIEIIHNAKKEQENKAPKN